MERWSSRRPTAVVPTMRVQSAMASARLLNSSARARRGEAPTAERASRKANSYGFTTRRWKKPKLLMARAAAPMLRGLRGLTRTTRKLSSWDEADKERLIFSAAAERKASTTHANGGKMNGGRGAAKRRSRRRNDGREEESEMDLWFWRAGHDSRQRLAGLWSDWCRRDACQFCAGDRVGTGRGADDEKSGRGARGVWETGRRHDNRGLHAEEFKGSGGEDHYVRRDADGAVGAGPRGQKWGRGAGIRRSERISERPSAFRGSYRKVRESHCEGKVQH